MTLTSQHLKENDGPGEKLLIFRMEGGAKREPRLKTVVLEM
jgi:hypothetical protein